MDLPVMPPVKPMLAKPAAKIPPGMHYEAKWDGFRAIVFRDGDEIEIGSRTGKPLTRYFPELVAALREHLPRAVRAGRRDRDRARRAAGLRRAAGAHPPGRLPGADAGGAHPGVASSPSTCWRWATRSLLDDAADRTPGAAGRRRWPGCRAPVHLAPATTDAGAGRATGSSSTRAPGWTGSSPSRSTCRYRPDERVMVKVKHERTADCVVAGLPPAQERPGGRLAAARPVRRRGRAPARGGVARPSR